MSGPIVPGAMLGVLGGGQLGAMFAAESRRLGYRVAVWDPDPHAPAHRCADLSLRESFTNQEALQRFKDQIQAATYEWENVPVPVTEALERWVPVRPGSAVLRVLQNRLDQKTFLTGRGFSVTPFRAVSHIQELSEAAAAIGFPCLCKTATAGYDGKGQWRLSSVADAAALQHALSRTASPDGRWIIERFVAFTKELSVLVVRGVDGDRRVYPVADNVHEGGILRVTGVPAAIEPSVAERAHAMSALAIEALDGVGVFCVELFLLPDGSLTINEIAPRPHNSGHYTLDACAVSQFEQQVRALCELPLGDVRLMTPAAMLNLIGDDLPRVLSEPGITTLLQMSGSKLHVYGKASIRPGRKMGHVTFLAGTLEEAEHAAFAFQRFLRSPSD